jgi:hypothetical protein
MSLIRLVFTKIWTRDSSVLLGGFFVTIFLIVYIWWPLAEEVLAYIDWNGPWWLYMDWLLLGIFLFMSLTVISRADLKTDRLIVFVGVFGGLAINQGTRPTWAHYTAERPPLWIIPAWPIAICDRINAFGLDNKKQFEHKVTTPNLYFNSTGSVHYFYALCCSSLPQPLTSPIPGSPCSCADS